MNPTAQRKTPQGLSFFGIALILLGISAVAAVTIPLWFQRPSITLNRAAELLVKDIQQVQEHAILSRIGTRIEFDAGGYQVLDATGAHLPAPMENGPFVRDYDHDAVFDGVKVLAADFGGERTLEFGQDGYSLHDGSVVLEFGGENRRVLFENNVAFIEKKKGE